MSNAGASAAIREVLAAADDSLQVRQIQDALTERGHTFSRQAVRQLIDERAKAGEFIRNEIGGHVSYTVNPEFVSKAPKRPPGKQSEVITAALEVLRDAKRPLSTANLHLELTRLERAGGMDRVALANALNYQLTKGRVRRERIGIESHWLLATPDDSTPPPASPASAAAAPPPPAAEQAAAPAAKVDQGHTGLGPFQPANQAAPVADRFALRDRLLAIAGDTQDALDDACAAELPHALIRHLVAANGATQRALLALQG